MKSIPRWSLVATAFIMTAAVWPARAETQSWRYVVAPFQSPDQVAMPAPAPSLAPMGMLEIVPEGSSVTVTIADDVHPDGRFLLRICQPNEPHAGDYHCGAGHDDVSTGDVCTSGPETLAGLVPGNPVEITLRWAPSPCPDSPTTGTITVVA